MFFIFLFFIFCFSIIFKEDMWFNDIFKSFIFYYSILLFLFSLFHFLLCLAFQYALSFYVSLLVFSRNSVIAHPCKSIATLWACALGHNPKPKHKFGIKSHIRIQARSGIYNLAHSYVMLNCCIIGFILALFRVIFSAKYWIFLQFREKWSSCRWPQRVVGR